MSAPLGPPEDDEPIDPESRSRLAEAAEELAATPTGPAHAFSASVERFDHRVDAWFDHLRGQPTFDAVFEAASRLGDWSLVWQLLNSADGLVGPTGPERAANHAVVLAFESVLVNQGIKRLFNRVRPVADQAVAGRIRAPRTSSFPSGHASAAFTAAGLLTAGHPRRIPAVYAIAVVVATSRIHTRMHHPSDVVAGALTGATIARSAKRWWPAH